MVARLPTEQEVVGSSPTLGLGVLVAQLADRPLHTRKAQGSIPCENSFVIFAEGRAFNPPRELFIRYGVVGNMSGSHPVASGSIPGIGLVDVFAFVVKWYHSCLPSSWRGFDSPRTQKWFSFLSSVGRALC